VVDAFVTRPPTELVIRYSAERVDVLGGIEGWTTMSGDGSGSGENTGLDM